MYNNESIAQRLEEMERRMVLLEERIDTLQSELEDVKSQIPEEDISEEDLLEFEKEEEDFDPEK